MFQKATRKKAKLRLALEGSSGSGKTTAALLIAKALGDKIAVIDTEQGSASLYESIVPFDVCELNGNYAPEKYVEAIQFAENAGYDVLIIDSITHEWKGPGGCLEIQSKLGGRFQDWAKVTPRHDRFVHAILNSKCHVICTCRTKTAYEFDQNSKKVTKAGTSPEQRDGLDYEMTVVFSINQEHMATATKDRTGLFNQREHIINEATGNELLQWLNAGADDPNSPELRVQALALLAEAQAAGFDVEPAKDQSITHAQRVKLLQEMLKGVE